MLKYTYLKKYNLNSYHDQAKPGSFNDQQKRLTYTAGLSINNINNSEVVVNNCNVEPNLESPVQPG